MVAIACIGVRIRTRHVEHAGPTEAGETVGSSSCGIQLSPRGGTTQMISDCRPHTNRKDFRQGRRRKPAANGPSVGTLAVGPPIAAPRTGNGHTDLLCYLWPGQAYQLQRTSRAQPPDRGRPSPLCPDTRYNAGRPGTAVLSRDSRDSPTYGVARGTSMV